MKFRQDYLNSNNNGTHISTSYFTLITFLGAASLLVGLWVLILQLLQCFDILNNTESLKIFCPYSVRKNCRSYSSILFLLGKIFSFHNEHKGSFHKIELMWETFHPSEYFFHLSVDSSFNFFRSSSKLTNFCPCRHFCKGFRIYSSSGK